MEKRVEYIFFEKERKKEKNIEEKDGKNYIRVYAPIRVEDLIEEHFNSIEEQNRDVREFSPIYQGTFKHNDKEIRYIVRKVAKYKMIYFTIIYSDTTTKKCIDILEEVHKIIISYFKKAYIIIVSNDDISAYYCSKLYDKLDKFDRGLRQLIFNIYTFSYGIDWYNKSIDPKLKDKTKNKIGAKAEIEQMKRFLYSLDYSSIKELLFTSRYTTIEEEYRKEKLGNINDFSKLSDKEIREIINNLKPKSDWERIFKQRIQLDNMESLLDNINKFRIIVAHCKLLSKKEYEECNKLLNETNRKVKKAINISLSKDFMLENIEYVNESISKLAEQMKNMFSNIAKMQVNAIGNVFSDINNKIDLGIGNLLSGINMNLQIPTLNLGLRKQLTTHSIFTEKINSTTGILEELSIRNAKLSAIGNNISPKLETSIKMRQLIESRANMFNMTNIQEQLNLSRARGTILKSK